MEEGSMAGNCKTSRRGVLYLVATPIGNLKDASPRAKEIIESCDVVFCEDTRKFGGMLKKLKVSPPPSMLSFYTENEKKRTRQAIKFLKEGKKVCLVSNAGTPLISDPGFSLVQYCLKNFIRVIPVPGPTAFVTAAIASGFPLRYIFFLGFVKKNYSGAEKMFKNCKRLVDYFSPLTFVFYVSPYRLKSSLQSMFKIFGDIEVVLAFELTKIHEEIKRIRLSKAVNLYKQNIPKGEVTVVFSLSDYAVCDQ